MKTPIPLCLACLLIFSSTSYGAVVNGSFEDPDAGFGWGRKGIAGIVGSGFGVNPTDGDFQALLRTGDGSVGNTGASIADLATFLSITPADITAVAPNAFNGTAMSQAITVNALDTLSFDWNFLTAEGAGNPQDTAFFSLGSAGTPPTFFLANPANAAGGPVGIFARQTGYSSYSHQFTTGGNYVIGFGVVNVDDAFGPSALLFDNVKLTAVPEPTALAGLGLLGLSLCIRRRRRI